jgi:hypothetical protein
MVFDIIPPDAQSQVPDVPSGYWWLKVAILILFAFLFLFALITDFPGRRKRDYE